MNDEIKNILENTENGEFVLKYIEELEKHIHNHHHNENCDCDCHDHEHEDNCDCGCHDHNHEDDWKEVQTPYNSSLSVKEWEYLLKNPMIFDKDSLIVLKRMRHIAAPTSYMELADTFGFGAMYYQLEIEKLTKRLLPYIKAEKLEKTYHWSTLFNSWQNKNVSDDMIFALIPELYEALGNIDLSNIPLRENQI